MLRHEAAKHAFPGTMPTAAGSVELGFKCAQCFPEAFDIASQLGDFRLELFDSRDAVSLMGRGWRRLVRRQHRFRRSPQKMIVA